MTLYISESGFVALKMSIEDAQHSLMFSNVKRSEDAFKTYKTHKMTGFNQSVNIFLSTF